MSSEPASAIEPTDLTDETEAAMLRALGSILRSGAFLTGDVETLAAAASNVSIQPEARCFARQSMSWLAEQSAMMTTPIWERNSDARH